MRRRNLMVRVYRALSGRTQKGFAKLTGLHHVLVAQYEQDQVNPSPGHLERAGQGVGLTVAAGEQILNLADTLRQPRKRGGRGAEGFAAELSCLLSGFYQRLLRLPLAAIPRRAED